MKISFTHQDFIAGSLFALTGLGVAFGSTAYAMGTPMRMGPGYFPLLLAIVLLALGVIIALRGVALTALQHQAPRDASRHVTWPSLRPLVLISAGMLLFAGTLKGAGLALATLGLVGLSGIAYREFRWGELSLLGVTLSIFAVVVFAYGLGLPFRILPS